MMMKNIISFLLTLAAISNLGLAAEAGSSSYGANRYTESVVGNTPILILAPDGGTITPLSSSVPKPSPSKIFARKLIDEINLLTGHYPHAVFNHLAPSYLDVESELADDAEQTIKIAFEEYRGAREAAKKGEHPAKIITVDVCNLQNNRDSILSLLKAARSARGSKQSVAISSLAKSIIGEANQNESVDLYAKVSGKINVGVFRVDGSMSNSAIYAMRIDPNIRSIGISSSQIAGGILDDLDVLVLPGGSGSRQVRELKKDGGKNIEAFVEQGGGYIGFCAGAYSGSERTSGKSSSTLNLLKTHPDHEGKGWARGGAMTKFENTAALNDFLPEYAGAESIFYAYNQGPLLEIKDAPGAENYVVLQRFVSDVHHNRPESKGVMPGKIALIVGDRKHGKVVLCSAHPEATAGMRWMAPRMVYWSLGRDGIPYDAKYVRPRQYQDEVMYDKKRNATSDGQLKVLMDQSKPTAQRLAALVEVVKTNPRRFKSRVDLNKLLYTQQKPIRLATVEATVELDFFEVTGPLKEAYVNEPDREVRERIKNALSILDVL